MSWAQRTLRGTRLRVFQFARSLSVRPDVEIDARLIAALNCPAQWRLLARLAPYDRAHHLRAYELLLARGHTDSDLLVAALLHDVGKADQRGRVRAAHRVAIVLLSRCSPRLLDWLSRANRPRPLHGVYLARHHATLGAALAAEAGASARVCKLIAEHERRLPADDPLLGALIEADEQAVP